MIKLKTYSEIELIRESANLVVQTHAMLAKLIKPGINSLYLDKVAEEFIRDNGGKPGFKGYNNFPFTLCVSPDDQVVHGLPSDEEIKSGTILSIDCGVLMNGFYGDCAYSFAVGELSDEKRKLLDVTKESLERGVIAAKYGNKVGDIGFNIQNFAESNGFSVVKELVGHGIGKQLHEAPEVPNYGNEGTGSILDDGLVIAIEPMINMGSPDIEQKSDGWTIVTKDRAPSAHFEYTVAVKKGKTEVLSPFSIIEDNLKQDHG